MNKEMFNKIESKLYNYFKNKKTIYSLKDKITNLENKLNKIKEDIKCINITIDDYKSVGFDERVQTSLKAGSTFENQICAEIGKLEEEYIITFRKLLKTKRDLRDKEDYINSFKSKINILEEEDKRFLELKYADSESILTIARKLNIAQATAYRKREEIVEMMYKLIA